MFPFSVFGERKNDMSKRERFNKRLDKAIEKEDAKKLAEACRKTQDYILKHAMNYSFSKPIEID